MKNSTNLFKRITALAIAGISALTVTACGSKTPMETIEDAAAKSEKTLTSSELYSTLEDFTNGGSIEIKANLSEILKTFAGIPLDMDASIKLYSDADAKNPASAIVAALGMDDTSLLDIAAYYTEEYLAVSSETLLDGDAYGITYGDIEDKFDDSIFGEGGDYELPEEAALVVESLAEATAASAENAEIVKNLEESIEKFIDEIKPGLYKSMEENGNAKIVDGTVEIADEDVKTSDVVFNFDAEDIIKSAEDTLTQLKDSKKLLPAIEAVVDFINKVYESADVDEIPELDADELYDQFVEFIEEGIDAYSELDFSELDMDMSMDVVAHIAKKTGELISYEVELEVDDVMSAELEIKFPTSLSGEWGFSGEVTQHEYDETVGFEIAYRIDTNTKTDYEASLYMEAITPDGSESFDLFNVEWDKKNGDYTLEVMGAEDYVAFALEGEYLSDSKSKTIAVSEITVDGETIDLGEIAIIIKAEDKMPTIKEYTDILDFAADEFESLGEDLVDSFMSIGSMLGGF